MKLTVEDLTCGHCVRTVTHALQALDADAIVSVDLPGKTVLVQGRILPAEAVQALAAHGYTAVTTDPLDSTATSPASSCCGSCQTA